MRHREGRSTAFTPAEFEGLLTGTDWFRDGDGLGDLSVPGWPSHGEHPFEWERAEQLWGSPDVRRRVMAYHLQDPAAWAAAGNVRDFFKPPPGGPGTRPFIWWLLEAPELRKLAGNDGTNVLHIVPAEWRRPGSPPVLLGGYWEPEHVYLERLGLLSEAEIEYLKAHPERCAAV